MAGKAHDHSRLRLRKETTDNLHIFISFFVLRRVARLCEREPLHFLKTAEVRKHNAVLCLIIAAIQQERRHFDARNVLKDSPALKATRNVELGWAIPECFQSEQGNLEAWRHIHCHVDGRIFLKPP